MFGLTRRGARVSARAGRRRRASFAAAFAALALLLLTPVCDAVAAQAAHSPAGSTAAHTTGHADGDGDHDSPGCCSTIEGSTLVNPANPLIDGGPGEGWNAALPLPAAALETAQLSRRDAILGAAPPLQSFYARSARIRQ